MPDKKTIKFIWVWDYQPTRAYLDYIEQNHMSISEVIIDQMQELGFYKIGIDDIVGMARLVRLCKRLNLPLSILTSTSTFNPTFVNFDHPTIDYPCWWIAQTLSRMRESVPDFNSDKIESTTDLLDNSIGTGYDIKHLYISLNGRGRPHRCIFIDTLAKHDLIELGVVSWIDALESPKSRTEFPPETLDSVARGHKYKYWTPERLTIDQHVVGLYQLKQERLPDQYFHAFMQVVAETSCTGFFITEKTAVPLLFNKPFIVLGCKHFHKNLQTLGFELYDEVFDYSFDEEDDVSVRCELIAQNLNKLKNKTMLELEEITKTIAPKLSRNRKLALHHALNLPDELKEVVSRLVAEKRPYRTLVAATARLIDQYRQKLQQQ